MKQFLFLLFCFATLTYCDNKEDEPLLTCECECTDLTWLQKVKNTLTNCDRYTNKYIYQAVYEEQTVFYVLITNNDPAALTMFKITLWDCEGNIVKIFEAEEKEKFYEMVTDNILLFSCKDS
ncbi:hypothetical protein [Labilibaculum euxinus]|uniref:Uncharacterized protein n=1 Tax=Labilibaculum euxinus TaxID=2686357 RepID=A0A7M4D3B6_9BACT|nr:hypothetical protein [Labilibaculum euxinus]MUP37145.1 hypothetical protein [Labilibaculum euxinus]MVB06350.1 hypothetical protein [Labilibaculum euxinus]